MNKISRRVIAAAGALALTGGTAVAAAAPASAATLDNYSYATVSFFGSPVALAENDFGQHLATVGSFSVLSHLVSGGNVADTATNSGASSNVSSVNVRSNLAALGLTARVVRSSCTANGLSTNGSTTILGGLVGVGRFGEPVDTFPSQDEEIDLPGGIEVFLNDQVDNGSSLTVTAMIVELPSGLEIPVGVSVCDES